MLVLALITFDYSSLQRSDKTLVAIVPQKKLPDSSVESAQGFRLPPTAHHERRPGMSARLQVLMQTGERVFDLKEETYLMTNSTGIPLADIQFNDQDKPETQLFDSTKVNAAAFALLRFNNGRRVCSVRVIRPTSDEHYSPRSLTTAFQNIARRATIAHELAHCADWYETGLSGWSMYRQQIAPPADGLAVPDQPKRSSVEFADIYAIRILRQTYGDTLAQDAVEYKIHARRKTNAVWY